MTSFAEGLGSCYVEDRMSTRALLSVLAGMTFALVACDKAPDVSSKSELKASPPSRLSPPEERRAAAAAGTIETTTDTIKAPAAPDYKNPVSQKVAPELRNTGHIKVGGNEQKVLTDPSLTNAQKGLAR